jgi:hypothetical protein
LQKGNLEDSIYSFMVLQGKEGPEKKLLLLRHQESNKNVKQHQYLVGSGMYLVSGSPTHDGGREMLGHAPHRVSHLQ